MGNDLFRFFDSPTKKYVKNVIKNVISLRLHSNKNETGGSMMNNGTVEKLRNGFGGEVGQEAIDAAFVIIVTFIVFTMQSGFGLLESGKNRILI